MLTTGLPVSRLAGYAPALPTPFDENDKVDFSAFSSLCDRQIRLGANALVVCGTTGEAPTLSRTEQEEIVRVAVGMARGRIPVIAGAGSNSTSHAIELARDAERRVPTRCCASYRTTTNPRKSASTLILTPLRIRSGCPSSFMTSRLARAVLSPTIRSRDLPNGRSSSASRMRRAISRARSSSGRSWGPSSGCFPATTPQPWRSSLKEAMAASRLRRT
jgi:hypothetical protein